MNLSASANSRFFIGFIISSLLFGSASFAVNAVNTPESGYILCVNKKTQAVTFPGTDKCPKGSSQLLLGAQGLPGVKGDKGDAGLAGVNGASGAQGPTGAVGPVGPVGATGSTGARGSSLLTGVGTPSNQLGDEGDTYIDKNAAQIYGPKKSGVWGYGTSFGGRAGAAGPAGAVGPAGSNGISHGYFKNLTSDINLTNANNTVITSIAVPAGKYFAFYNTNFLSFDSTSNYFGCDFVATTADGSGKTVVLAGGRDSYSKNGFVVVPSDGGNIQVHCRLLNSPGNSFVLYHGSLNVIALDMVTNS